MKGQPGKGQQPLTDPIGSKRILLPRPSGSDFLTPFVKALKNKKNSEITLHGVNLKFKRRVQKNPRIMPISYQTHENPRNHGLFNPASPSIYAWYAG
jgi:hypothetical protein